MIRVVTHAYLLIECVDFVDFGYYRYFMLDLFKFLHKKTEHRLSIISKVIKN